MTNTEKLFLTFPIGRMLSRISDEFRPDTEHDGTVKTFKVGRNIGKTVYKHWFYVGIKKGAEKHWKETAWGSQIYAVAKQKYPTRVDLDSFSWKITDGDSTKKNDNGVAPCEKDGYKGHWVVGFNSLYPVAKATYLVTRDGKRSLPEGARIEAGDYVQVFASVVPNTAVGPTSRAGVYINQISVAHCALGEPIVIESRSTGFGVDPLPEGAKVVESFGYDDILQ